MNFAVRINNNTFPFKTFNAALEALDFLRGATLHRIYGMQGNKFMLSKPII